MDGNTHSLQTPQRERRDFFRFFLRSKKYEIYFVELRRPKKKTRKEHWCKNYLTMI